MIVNPQLFNYRLIIGSLIVTVAAITTVSFFSYKSLETERAFLESENQLIRKELDQALIQYDEVKGINNELKLQIENSEQVFQFRLDSVTSLPAEEIVQATNSPRISSILKRNSYLQGLTDSLREENTDLAISNQQLESNLANSQTTNATLSKELIRVREMKNLPSLAMINSLEVTPYRESAGKKTLSIKASSANVFEICLTLANDTFNSNLDGDLFIQILDPNNNVVADKGAMTFGNASLIYSGKYNLNNLSDGNHVCLDITTDKNDRPLKKGAYKVNVFHNDTMLENTTIVLN